MTVIKQDDLIQSVADALQFISYYHPVDFIQAMHEAYLREESPAARDSMAQILINSRMCATGHRPICQDTGIVTVFVRVGMDVRWDGATMGLDDILGVAAAAQQAIGQPEQAGTVGFEGVFGVHATKDGRGRPPVTPGRAVTLA